MLPATHAGDLAELDALIQAEMVQLEVEKRKAQLLALQREREAIRQQTLVLQAGGPGLTMSQVSFSSPAMTSYGGISFGATQSAYSSSVSQTDVPLPTFKPPIVPAMESPFRPSPQPFPLPTSPMSVLNSPAGSSSVQMSHDEHGEVMWGGPPAAVPRATKRRGLQVSSQPIALLGTAGTSPRTDTDSDSTGQSDTTGTPRQRRKSRRMATQTSLSLAAVLRPRDRFNRITSGVAMGDRSILVDQFLEFPPFYFADIDSEAAAGEDWMLIPTPASTMQPDVVREYGNVLLCHANVAKNYRRRGGQAASDSSDSGTADSAVSAGLGVTTSHRAASSRQAQKSGRKAVDWLLKYRAWEQQNNLESSSVSSSVSGISGRTTGPACTSTNLDPRGLLADEVYVQLVNVLRDPIPQLQNLKHNLPQLYQTIVRTLTEKRAYHPFWGRVSLCLRSDPSREASHVIPVLYHVNGEALHSGAPDRAQCRRAVPLSYVGQVLNDVHCGRGDHRKTLYTGLSEKYCNIPREAVEVFGQLCKGCNLHERKAKNKKPPKAILSHYARERYVLDLVDMKEWQQRASPKTEGKEFRYVCNMVDHYTKRR